tara:strand:- start:470 stop:1534 length:1065 start_codon:yes stop_codon:yes gene_type:complete
MKRAIRLFLPLLIVLLFTQCESSRKTSSGLSVTGKIGQILVVCEQGIWESKLQEGLDSNLVQYILPYLPDVATFKLIHKTPQHFTQGIKRFRNTLFINIDPDYKGETGKIEKRKDVWALGQLVIDITAKDYNQLSATCEKGLAQVHKEFNNYSWQRIIPHFENAKNKGLRSKLKTNFGLDLVMPSNSRLVTSRKNFYRIEFPSASRPIEFVGSHSEDAGTVYSGIMVYQYDYIDSSQFELEKLLNARDTMLKYNVPSEVDGMYMGTQYNDFVYPEGNTVKTFDKQLNGFEMRGMFMFKGRPKHSTGGAFWAFHFINKRKKMVCVSGYVDAPMTTPWTHQLREIQAVLRSIKVVK